MTNFKTSDLIDWQKIWDSLEWDNKEDQQETIRERLHLRARQYAAPVKHDASGIIGNTRTVLVFDLGTEQYSVDVMLVRGIRPMMNITVVPATPTFYRGVVNVRGEIVSVMDLRLFYDMPVQDSDALSGELIIVEANGLRIGLLAHHVEGVLNVLEAAIESFADLRYTVGVTTDGLVLLDIARMFEDSRMIVGRTED
jgi:purine-binding chemotaxis protein CheW